MREHEYYQELISRLADGDLSPEEEEALREHMRACPECRRLAAAFADMTAALREDQAVPPKDLVRGVMARLAEEESPAPVRRGRRTGAARTLRPWVRLGAAACLVLILSGAAFFALQNGRGGDAPAAAMAQMEAEPPLPEPAVSPEAETDPGQEPMMISAQDGAPAAGGTIPAGDAAEQTAVPSPTEEPSPLPVYDAARTRVGSIATENIPAFLALITDAGGSRPSVSFDYLFKVEYLHKSYCFATDDNGGLFWWEEPSTQPIRSPGSLEDLHRLIAMDPPALPQ